MREPWVSALSAAFAPAYGPNRGCGISAPVDDTLMIEPPSPAAIRSPTRALSRNGPLKLTLDDLVEQFL